MGVMVVVLNAYAFSCTDRSLPEKEKEEEEKK